ncbi:hypothetical protein EXN66_Car009930 [Channa argus]|uniref:Uncharacterized protein n=1 Tax=Channa argus TaxID=215402 RepID=A0A6G1PVT7_CHAAH|nr:hypothetical protein EXN66_Car009930 [Channa argus]
MQDAEYTQLYVSSSGSEMEQHADRLSQAQSKVRLSGPYWSLLSLQESSFSLAVASGMHEHTAQATVCL